MIPEEFDVMEHGIARVNWILARMPKIENRLDDINRQLFPSAGSSITVKQWCELVNERSNLRLELKRLESELKEQYHLVVDESEKIIINAYDINP